MNRLKFETINFYIYPQFSRAELFHKLIANVMNNTTITNIFNSDNSNIAYINT